MFFFMSFHAHFSNEEADNVSAKPAKATVTSGVMSDRGKKRKELSAVASGTSPILGRVQSSRDKRRVSHVRHDIEEE